MYIFVCIHADPCLALAKAGRRRLHSFKLPKKLPHTVSTDFPNWRIARFQQAQMPKSFMIPKETVLYSFWKLPAFTFQHAQMPPSAAPATQKCRGVTRDQGDPSASPDPAQSYKCHACHAKRRWMSPSAAPAT